MKAFAKKILPPFLLSKARSLKYRLDYALQTKRSVTSSIFGTDVTVSLRDKFAEKWYGQPVKLFPSFAFMTKNMIPADGTIFYIGAHHCIFGIALSKLMNDRIRIVAVEANPENYKTAKENIRINGMKNIELVNAAIADATGTIRFSLGHSVHQGKKDQPYVEVPAITIDGMLVSFGLPDLIILDVEGFEAKALFGAQKALGSGIGWCVEVHVGAGLESFGGSAEQIAGAFRGNPSEMWIAKDYGDHPVVPYAADSPILDGRHHLLVMRRNGGV